MCGRLWILINILQTTYLSLKYITKFSCRIFSFHIDYKHLTTIITPLNLNFSLIYFIFTNNLYNNHLISQLLYCLETYCNMLKYKKSKYLETQFSTLFSHIVMKNSLHIAFSFTEKKRQIHPLILIYLSYGFPRSKRSQKI